MSTIFENYLSIYNGDTVEEVIARGVDIAKSNTKIEGPFLQKTLMYFDVDAHLNSIILTVTSAFSKSVDEVEYTIIDDTGNILINIDTEILKIQDMQVIYEIHKDFLKGQSIFITATSTKAYGSLSCKLILAWYITNH